MSDPPYYDRNWSRALEIARLVLYCRLAQFDPPRDDDRQMWAARQARIELYGILNEVDHQLRMKRLNSY